jgi:hypothetical protein
MTLPSFVLKSILKHKPSSTLHSVAEHFHRDAVDFADRFDLLWESSNLMHKMGRIKSFVDLLMGCECGLKSHALLSMTDNSPSDAYRKVRSCGHNIEKLASLAAFMPDRCTYENLANNLKELPVHIRYSLNAYETFFPSFFDKESADQNYSATIGNNVWVLNIRESLRILNASVADVFFGEVSMDFDFLLQQEKDFRKFADECLK